MTSSKKVPKKIQSMEALAIAHLQQGRNAEALASYQILLEHEPKNTDALNNAGTLLGGMKRHDEAISLYQRALIIRPDYAEALNNLAVSLAALNRNDEAVARYDKAIALKPAYPDALKNRAELLARMGRNDEALLAYDQALKLVPNIAELHNNRGTVLNALNRHSAALGSYDHALHLKPQYPDALNNRGIALAALNRFDEALQCFRTAIQLQPDYVNAHWNESLSLLRLGQFEEGWKKHEWRWQKTEFVQHRHSFKQPLWLGKEDIAGKTLLLTSEQGFGDVIHFVRYVTLIEARAAKVLLFVPEPLVALLQASFPNAQVFNKVAEFPCFDFHCPLISLPLAFGTQVESIPASMPYLRVPADRMQAWQARQIFMGQGIKTGIVWAGSASHKNDVNRSIPFADFSCLFSQTNAHFFVLQKDIPAPDKAALQQFSNVTLLGDELTDFANTAAAISLLDLVITVDTSVAHLAAALGKPTWILLPHVSDWRWMPGRNESAWYPTAYLYWQQGVDQWPQVLQRVATDLGRYQPTPTAFAPAAVSVQQAFNTANDLLRAGNLADAQAICTAVLQLDPNYFAAHQLMGAIYLQQQHITDAITHFQKAVDLNPVSVAALNNLCAALRIANRHQDALVLYDIASALATDNPSIPTNRAVSLIALKRYPEALASLDKTLAMDPDNIAALNNVGVVYNEMRCPEDALKNFDRALKIKPGYLDAANNRGLSLIALNRPNEASENYLRVLADNPGNADALNNRGLALAAMNRNIEALECFRQAQQLKPGYIDAHWNESLINLVQGNFADGWRQYEWRWKKPEFAPHKREFHLPQWTGKQDLKDRTIFLYFEQGFGDTIQFVRYIDCLDALGAKVILSVPPTLRRLIENSFPNVQVFCGDETLPQFDFYSPLLSLPLAFGTALETIVHCSPYLRAPEERLMQWQAFLPQSKKIKIGLVWSGNSKHLNDRNRSIPLAALDDVLQNGRYQIVVLQKEISAEDEALLRQRNISLPGEHLNDFSDTAAAIMQLDLVISVDTSVAHLTGALGKPLWLLLPFAPDWRWLLEREDSPWYPTARLFRQQKPGDVAGQIKRLSTELSKLT